MRAWRRERPGFEAIAPSIYFCDVLLARGLGFHWSNVKPVGLRNAHIRKHPSPSLRCSGGRAHLNRPFFQASDNFKTPHSGKDNDDPRYFDVSNFPWEENSSSAVYLRRPPASCSSTILSYPSSYPYELVRWSLERGSTENPYKLCDLQGQVDDHKDARDAIKDWLANKAEIPAHRILIDKKIAGLIGFPLLWTSGCKRPDLQVTSANKCVLQIEVESGDLESTVRKLGIGLVDQLRWLRNHKTTIKKCSGFYFMSGSKTGHVIHVEVMWEDKLLNFVLNRRRLPMGNVATKVKEVLREAQQSLDSTASRCMAHFTLPISSNPSKMQPGKCPLGSQLSSSM